MVDVCEMGAGVAVCYGRLMGVHGWNHWVVTIKFPENGWASLSIYSRTE